MQKRQGRGRTVRGTLLGTYTVLILLAFAVLATAFSLIHGNRVRSEVLNTLSQQAQSMAAAADREIDQMRTMAMNITYSTRLQDRLYLRQGTSGGLSEEADRLSMILSLIVLPNRPIDQINLYTRDGNRVSSGMDNEITRDSAETKPWYGPLSEQENAQLLFFSGRDEKLSKYVTDAYGKEFVTLVLENYDNFGTRCGYIEIRQRISRILSAMMAYRPGFGESVFFFDREGKQIFPAAEEEPLFALAADRGFPGAFTAAGDGRLLCCVPAGRGQFYTVMSIRGADLFRSMRDQIVTILLITLGALMVTVLASGLVSRRITRPLADICDQVGRIELEHPEPLPAVDSDIREIQTLHTSFSRMQETLSGHVTNGGRGHGRGDRGDVPVHGRDPALYLIGFGPAGAAGKGDQAHKGLPAVHGDPLPGRPGLRGRPAAGDGSGAGAQAVRAAAGGKCDQVHHDAAAALPDPDRRRRVRGQL